jgi:flagellar biosynthesis protein FlhA
METLADWGPTVKSAERLTEQARLALARTITGKHTNNTGVLTLVSMTPSLERTLNDCLQVTEQGSYLAMEPSVAQIFISKLKKSIEKFSQMGVTPVLLAPFSLRPALYSFTERFLPGFVVLSHQEITPNVKVQSLGVLGLDG